MTLPSPAVNAEESKVMRKRRLIHFAIAVVVLFSLTYAGVYSVLQKLAVTLNESVDNTTKSADSMLSMRQGNITTEKAIHELSILATQLGGGFAAELGLSMLNGVKDFAARDEWFVQHLFSLPDAERTLIANQYRLWAEDYSPSLDHSMSAEMKAKVESCIESTNLHPTSWTLVWTTIFETHTSACKL